MTTTTAATAAQTTETTWSWVLVDAEAHPNDPPLASGCANGDVQAVADAEGAASRALSRMSRPSHDLGLRFDYDGGGEPVWSKTFTYADGGDLMRYTVTRDPQEPAGPATEPVEVDEQPVEPAGADDDVVVVRVLVEVTTSHAEWGALYGRQRDLAADVVTYVESCVQYSAATVEGAMALRSATRA